MDFLTWISDNAKANPADLRLKYHGKSAKMGFDVDNAIMQVECRRRFGRKLRDTLAENPRFIFPTVLSGEQSTSDLLASFHASLVAAGDRVVDLTAGLGIDAMHMAARGAEVTAVEINPEISKALIENSNSIGLDINVVNDDCCDYIDALVAEGKTFDVVFIDPARRASDGSRIFNLHDCLPDVTALLPKIRLITKRLIVKASPMLDITQTIADLPGCTRIIALGTPTECKELMAIVDFGDDCSNALDKSCNEPIIEAVTLVENSENVFSFTRSEESAAEPLFADPAEGRTLYEPWPAVMKAAPFALLSQRFGCRRIAANTQVFVADGAPDPDFPGTPWTIEQVIPYKSKHIKQLSRQYPLLSVAVRNFPIGADALRTKLGVKEPSTASPSYRRLLAVTDSAGNPLMLILSPFKNHFSS